MRSAPRIVSQVRPGFGARNPNPVRINPRPRRPTTTVTRQPVIDPECTDFVGKPGPAGPKGDKGDPGASPTTEEIARIVVAVIAENPDQFKGKDGTDGRDGAPGKDAHLDYDKLAQLIAERYPIQVELINAETGEVIKSDPVYLGGKLKLPQYLPRYKPES